MFASQRHRISDVEIATIIRSQGEKHALRRVAYVREMPRSSAIYLAAAATFASGS